MSRDSRHWRDPETPQEVERLAYWRAQIADADDGIERTTAQIERLARALLHGEARAAQRDHCAELTREAERLGLYE